MKLRICRCKFGDNKTLMKISEFTVCSSVHGILSYDVMSGSEITPCIKIDKPLVVYRFTGNVMMSITTLRT